MRFLTLAAALVAATIAPAALAGDSSRDQVIATVTVFAKSWETGDLAQFESTLDDNLLCAHPGGTLDKPWASAFFKKWKTERNATRADPTQFIVEGNRVRAEYQFCATNMATGKREPEGAAAIGEIGNGRLV